MDACEDVGTSDIAGIYWVSVGLVQLLLFYIWHVQHLQSRSVSARINVRRVHNYEANIKRVFCYGITNSRPNCNQVFCILTPPLISARTLNHLAKRIVKKKGKKKFTTCTFRAVVGNSPWLRESNLKTIRQTSFLVNYSSRVCSRLRDSMLLPSMENKNKKSCPRRRNRSWKFVGSEKSKKTKLFVHF